MTSWINPTSYSSSIGTVPIANGGTALTALPTSVVASTYSAWDANSNLNANGFISAVVVEGNSSPTFLITSPDIIAKNAGGTDTYTLPVPSTALIGKRFLIYSFSAGSVNVKGSGGTSLVILSLGNCGEFICVQNGTDTTSWMYNITPANVLGSTAVNALLTAFGGTGTVTAPTAGSVVWGATTSAQGYTAAGTSGQPLLSGGSAVPTWGTLGVGAGGTALTALPTASAASTYAAWNADQKIPVVGEVTFLITTATSGGTITLLTSSSGFRVYTGTNTETIILPAAPVGYIYTLISTSTGAVTVQSSGANTITTLNTNQGATFVCNTAAGTTAASWTWYPLVYQIPAFISPLTTGGDLLYGGASGSPLRLANGTSGQVLTSSGTTLAPTWQTVSGTGSVTSVAMTVPTFLSVSGTPITTSGTLGVTLSGTALPVANGGTALTSLPTGQNASSYLATDADSVVYAQTFIGNTDYYITANTIFYATVADGALQLPSVVYCYNTSGTIIVTLPLIAHMQVGRAVTFISTSNMTGSVLIQDPTFAQLALFGPNCCVTLQCFRTSGTSVSSWSVISSDFVNTSNPTFAYPIMTNQDDYFPVYGYNGTLNMDYTWPYLINITTSGSGNTTFILPNPTSIPLGCKYRFNLVNNTAANGVYVKTFTNNNQIVELYGTVLIPGYYCEVVNSGGTAGGAANWLGFYIGYANSFQAFTVAD